MLKELYKQLRKRGCFSEKKSSSINGGRTAGWDIDKRENLLLGIDGGDFGRSVHARQKWRMLQFFAPFHSYVIEGGSQDTYLVTKRETSSRRISESPRTCCVYMLEDGTNCDHQDFGPTLGQCK
ncbi:hypothetical protein PAXINDRAFT_153339 [Paxillus involutus ATCC 200175]|nr:hypothetical protein PAXINDRAFT_153339 [Paxillus involutus ATCC 200175]